MPSAEPTPAAAAVVAAPERLLVVVVAGVPSVVAVVGVFAAGYERAS